MKRFFPLLFVLFLYAQAQADIRLPKILGDHMVLQRDQALRLWGWANPKERISVRFNGQELQTQADEKGEWEVELAPMRASASPLTMAFIGDNIIKLENILIGDVWLCGGQSNMEWTVRKSKDGIKAIAAADYPHIRLFKVERQAAFTPQQEVPTTGWQSAQGENISDFSAVGYFFGEAIHQSAEIPIGLISSNWGGTRAESWMSQAALAQYAHVQEGLTKMRAQKISYEAYRAQGSEDVQAWRAQYYPESDQGMEEKWYSNEYDYSAWNKMELPAALESQRGLADFDGVIWFKKEFTLPVALRHKVLFLRLGSVNHIDELYLNGEKVGETVDAKQWRTYQILPEKWNQEGKNILSVRVFNTQGKGGLVEVNLAKFGISTQRYAITLQDLSLVGEWQYRTSLQLEQPITAEIPRANTVRPDDFPASLYQGMIYPLQRFAIKGAIWYQGESNTKSFEDAVRYEAVFADMIKDWRAQWGYEFPFYFVQLANFRHSRQDCPEPCEQRWAYLRESQSNTLKLPQTGMAVIIDKGNPFDIHPKDKQVVGERMALIAKNQVYGDKSIVYSGPIFQSHQIKADKVYLDFTHKGSGLKVANRHGYLSGFQIAGKDQVFYWAKAELIGDQVVVSHPKVSSPVAVRYGWEDNPVAANLYNQEGLPASPFRTDDWKLYQE